MKKPKNENYAAVVVEISHLVALENCDNVQAAIIMGNQVIVGKNVKVGDVGLYFPLECQLSKKYLSANNLYKHKELNANQEKAGYFEDNGRIRCVKFRGHNSEGLFMPDDSLEFIIKTIDKMPKIGSCFDELDEVPICTKFVVKQQRTQSTAGNKKHKVNKTQLSKVIDNQFRFHEDTSMLYKNLHKIKPDSLISITYKMHGTSGISSYVLCKKYNNKLSKVKAFLWELTNKIENIFRPTKYTFELSGEEYDYLYSSRKVIKNKELNPNAQHYYNEDIWGTAHNEVKDFLQKGMTFYYEIVGYTSSGSGIQSGLGKVFDYGYEKPDVLSSKYVNNINYGIYIYRITSTNVDGKVIEFSAKQVQYFCKKNGLNAVPELYYGYAKDCFMNIYHLYEEPESNPNGNWNSAFLEECKNKYNEKDCYMCKNKLPEEGVVIRVEGNDLEAFKCKSNRFYAMETKQLDKGETNIEDEN